MLEKTPAINYDNCMKNTTAVGNTAETQACEYLQAKGYTIVERNYKDRFCEIDIVACNKHTLAFVEVKYRRRADFGGAVGSITPSKATRMTRSAEYWLATHDGFEAKQPCLDVITVVGDLSSPTIEHIQSAVET